MGAEAFWTTGSPERVRGRDRGALGGQGRRAADPGEGRPASAEKEVAIQGGWLPWALMSAVFAALTAIFAKVGLEGVDSDFATLIRTFVIVFVLGAFVLATGKWQGLSVIAGKSGLFLVLSALATGASWVCYYRALKIGNAMNVRARRQTQRRAGSALYCCVSR